LFGYALFLDRVAFEALLGALPDPAAIEEARATLMREFGRRPQFDGSSGSASEDWPGGHGGYAHDDDPAGGDGGGGDGGGGGD
jgi:hypothetical protein